MPKVVIDNHPVELTLILFLDAISDIVIALYSSYEGLFGLQILGHPNALRGKYKRMITRDIDFLSIFQGQVDDKILLTALRGLEKHLGSFNETSKKVRQVMVNNKKQYPVTSEEFIDSFPPQWIDQSPYSNLLIASSKRMLTIINDVEKIILRISQLRKELEVAPIRQVEQGAIQKYTALRKLIQNGIKKGYIKAITKMNIEI